MNVLCSKFWPTAIGSVSLQARSTNLMKFSTLKKKTKANIPLGMTKPIK